MEKTVDNFLIRGHDYVARHPDFRLVGSDQKLQKLSAILMRNKANSVLMVGAGGVGCTALCMGLEDSKKSPDAPFDIVNKRFFWLDTDGLFSSGDHGQINESFQKILSILTRTPDSVLVVEDTRDFIEAARNNGCTHFINALTSGIRTRKFQAILETRDDDLEAVLKCHSDMRECFTLMDVDEPVGENLLDIVTDSARNLEKFHGIRISPDAIKTAIELTNKYRTKDMGLSRAQPERSLTLLDRALTTYRLNAHKKPPELEEMEVQLASVSTAINTGVVTNGLQGKTLEELESMRADLETRLGENKKAWEVNQEEIKRLYHGQRLGEESIRDLEDDLEEQLNKEEESRKKAAEEGQKNPDENKPGGLLNSGLSAFAALRAKGGFESEAVQSIKFRIKQFQTEVDKNKQKFDELTKIINEKLLLDKDLVLSEFSNISGIPASKLNQDERERLLNLKQNLGSRVFGQAEAVERLSNAVITARVSRRRRDQPQASFLFLGPSGVGKTEIAKALAFSLLDDAAALTRFDMSEYMEKHAVAKLIGAPPGYEGFEAGGILTNAMRKNPYRILLFDEIEKAHPDVFNIFLQILSDGRLTDNVGRTVSFADSIIIMTTNLGQPHFLNSEIGFNEARKNALEDLGKTYRSEFLNRFNGRQNIVCFDRLELDSIEKIVLREIAKVDADYGSQGLNVAMDGDDLKQFCLEHYDPDVGARGLPGYINAKLESPIANTILENPDVRGVVKVRYNPGTKSLEIDPPKPALPFPSSALPPAHVVAGPPGLQ